MPPWPRRRWTKSPPSAPNLDRAIHCDDSIMQDAFHTISTNGPSTFLTGHVTHVTGLPPGLRPAATDAEMADQHRSVSLAYLRRHRADLPGGDPRVPRDHRDGKRFLAGQHQGLEQDARFEQGAHRLPGPLWGEPAVRPGDLLPRLDPVRRPAGLGLDRPVDGPAGGRVPAPRASSLGARLAGVGTLHRDPLHRLCVPTVPYARCPVGVRARRPVARGVLGSPRKNELTPIVQAHRAFLLVCRR